MTKALTAASVRKLKAAKERRVVRDALCQSLYLVIFPSGAKSWMMRFRRPDGRAAKMYLGRVDFSGAESPAEPTTNGLLTLAAARQLAARIHHQRAQGLDPIAQHKLAKRRRRTELGAAKPNTFRDAATVYLTEMKPKIRSWRGTARILGFDPDSMEPLPHGLAELWGDDDVRTIDKIKVLEVIEEARSHTIPGIVAKKKVSESRVRVFHSKLSRFFGWCLERHRIDTNPCRAITRPKPSQSRDRYLTDNEIRALWQAADTISRPFGAAVKLLALTGQRVREITELRWHEITENGTRIDLPASRTKNKRPHSVPLSAMAQAIIAEMPRIDGCDFVFTTTGTKPISGWSKMKDKIDEAMGVSDWRLHDLRRTAVTGMAELGIRPDVIELVVNHVSGTRSGIAGVYNRSEQLAERRAALERWSNHIAGLVADTPANVTRLQPRKA